MKTHELKLDIKYFDDVKTGKKNFEIRKNDRDFQVGDTLELKAYSGESYMHFGWFMWEQMDKQWFGVGQDRKKADTIKAMVTTIVEADRFNKIAEIENGKQQKILNIQKVIKDYFHTDRLPDGYVILGIEVVK